jgi:hypothetical protein
MRADLIYENKDGTNLSMAEEPQRKRRSRYGPLPLQGCKGRGHGERVFGDMVNTFSIGIEVLMMEGIGAVGREVHCVVATRVRDAGA